MWQHGGRMQGFEQAVDGMGLQRADDDGRHLAALHESDRDLGRVAPRGAHVGMVDAQRVFMATHEGRAFDGGQRAQRGLLAQVKPLDGLPAGVRQRLDDRRCPHACRVEQGDERGGGVEVGARLGEVLADRLRRRSGDDQIFRVPVDHLAARVDFGGHAFHDGGGREGGVRFGPVRPLLAVGAVGGTEVTEQGCEHADSCSEKARTVKHGSRNESRQSGRPCQALSPARGKTPWMNRQYVSTSARANGRSRRLCTNEVLSSLGPISIEM